MLRASLSAASTFGRPQPAAEDQFIQQNAWANPQHPAHQKHRQASVFSQAATTSATPANQKRVVEPHGSASTIADHPSGPNSSLFPTPAMEEIGRDAHSAVNHAIPPPIMDTTPSKITDGISSLLQSGEKSAIASRNEAGSGFKLFSSQPPSRDVHNLDAPSKSLPSIQSGESARMSPPLRNPIIKAEESGNIYGHSVVGQQSQGPLVVSAVSNG